MALKYKFHKEKLKDGSSAFRPLVLKIELKKTDSLRRRIYY